MNSVAVGFWGAFFGAIAMMLAGSLMAYVRSVHKVALRAALTAVLSALVAVTAAVVLVGWALPGVLALALGSVLALLVGAVALVVCIRGVRRGDRLAWLALTAIVFMLVAITGVSAIALGQVQAWPLQALSALAGMGYLGTISVALWSRYSYLIELREVMAHGPRYDPVTRMRSHAETGQLVGAVFGAGDGLSRPVGVIAISIGNLYALEQLHGRGAVNHALFVCASRLRRSVPGDVGMGRLGEDGFLLLARNSEDPVRLVAISRQVAQRLGQPVSVGISSDRAAPEDSRANWVADIGIGVLAAVTPLMRPEAAVSMARAMSRTAWSFGSRIAWFDSSRREIAELPLTDGAR